MHSIMYRVARAMALLGGLVLVVLVIITCVSVLGRSANTIGHMPGFEALAQPMADMFKLLGPVRGDFELVEAGVAFAIFAFLPWCQMGQGHATVDLFTSNLPDRFQRFLILLWEYLLSLVIVVLTWRLIVGTIDKATNGETTFLLQFPVWWAFAACSFIAVVASVVAIYVAVVRTREFSINADLLDRELESGH